MTTRRTFLRVLGSALVGAVVVPSLPIPGLPVPESAQSWWRAQDLAGPSRALTYDLLREAYEKCSRGPHHGPQYIITTREVADRYARLSGLVFDAEIAA